MEEVHNCCLRLVRLCILKFVFLLSNNMQHWNSCYKCVYICKHVLIGKTVSAHDKRIPAIVYTHTHKINDNLQNNAWPSTANMEKFTSPLLQKTKYRPNNHLSRERKNESVYICHTHHYSIEKGHLPQLQKAQ